MISFYAEALYVGEDERLRSNGMYAIEIWQNWRGRYIVGVTHGYERRIIADYVFEYRTLREMLANWTNIKPESFYRFSQK